jgi:septal ring factor EnvC (AmiA/AmiB activator)
VTKTSETQSQAEQTESKAPSSQSSRKSVLALAVFALGLNATAAAYTLSPSEFALPNISSLAELLPHQTASDPIPDPVVATLKDIQSTQQQHAASLTALLQQDSITLASLRQSVTDEQVDVKKISGQITDEHEDVKKISAQISKLMTKVDSLQTAMSRDVTSSIGQARNRLSSVARKRMARQPKPVGPVSVGGAPISFPATTPSPQG